jgi:predicted ATPase
VLLNRGVLPVETQRLLLERAGGNPLHAEEFVRMLRDRALLGERGRLATDAEIVVPDSIQSLIAARLDTLPADRKRLLQDAAVIGKVFWAGAAAAMGGREAVEVEDAFSDLARRELIRPAAQSSMEGEREYGFWHALVRDVAYAQIPRAERASRHLRAVDWIEQKAGGRLEDVADVLAYHADEACSLARATRDDALEAEARPVAARYALLAGERARSASTTQARSSCSSDCSPGAVGRPSVRQNRLRFAVGPCPSRT